MNAEERLREIVPDGSAPRLVEPGIYSLSPADASANEYDRLFGAFYDLVACNRVYNRIVWGYSIGLYHALCLEALGSSSGWMLDAGCGSLAFTARAYLASGDRPVVLLDQSLRLLRMARERLARAGGRVPDNMVFVHGDALRLPFRAGSFESVLSLNLLHVLDDPTRALREMRNALTGGGKTWCTTLVRSGRSGDWYLDRLAASKYLVRRNVEQVAAFFDAAGLEHREAITGNLAVIRANAGTERAFRGGSG